MSGKGRGPPKGEANWRCNKCTNLNFGWRLQCNRCKTRKPENDDGGLGVGTALLVGAGAAAVGFLAQGLWSAFQGSSETSPQPSAPPSSEVGTDDAARKRKRDAFRAQAVSKEMKCAICLVNPREICMLPCKHIYLCEDCDKEVKTKCPKCQEPVTGRKAIYL